MGFIKSLFKKSTAVATGGVSETLDSIGGLAKNIRMAIKNDIPADLRAELEKLLIELESKLLDLESQALKAQSSIIIAEAGGESWLQRNWRPVTMMVFLGLIVALIFGLVKPEGFEEIPSELWGLFKIGLGGYIVTQGAERVAERWNK